MDPYVIASDCKSREQENGDSHYQNGRTEIASKALKAS